MNLVEKVFTLAVYHRGKSMLLLLMVTLLTGLGVTRLQIDTGFSSLIPEQDPLRQVYERVSREFGSDNRTLIYVRDEALWSSERLASLEDLHYSLEALNFVERVDDLFTLRSIRGVNNELHSSLLMPEAPVAKDEIAAVREDALYNPLLVGNFLSADGNVTAFLVSIREQPGAADYEQQVYEQIEAAIEPLRGEFQQVFQIGSPRVNAELKSTLFEDLATLAPLSALLLVSTILLFLRSGVAAIIPLLTSALSIFWTMGLMGWTGVPVNILIAMLPSLVMAIGSTEDIHMLAAYFHGVLEAGDDHRRRAVHFMLRHMGVPLLLTVLTTGLGFASNLFSSIGMIQDFALASTIAIFSNGVITILLVPILLIMFGPVRTSLFQGVRRIEGVPGMFVKLFELGNRRFAGFIFLGTAILSSWFMYYAMHMQVSNDPLSYFQPDRPLIQDLNTTHRDLAGMKVFYINLESDQDRAFLEPKNVDKLVRIQSFMDEQGVFDRSISLADHLALVNREFHGGDEKYHRVPLRKEMIAQYLLFFHRRDLESYVSHDYQDANIVVRHNISNSRILNSYTRELEGVVRSIAGADFTAHVVSENLMINRASETLLMAQVYSLGILLLVIFLIMSAMFTSFKGGLIALIPSLFPIIMMFGCMGLLDIPLNPGTAMVAVIAIGIAIDGTIHLFSRYNELCRRTSDYSAAVSRTVREEATPMITTSLGLAAGFGVLLFSDFSLIAQFGALSAATMLFALFANLLITPMIMARVRLIGLYDILAITMQKDVLAKSPLFQDMSNYQMRKAILISELNEFSAGELLVEQGSRGRCMYLILSGRVSVIRHGRDTDERIAELGAGEIFGELGYIHEVERVADVRALENVEVLRFDYEKLQKDLRFFPYIVAQLNFNISRVLGERLMDRIGAEH